ncbi:MAG TPA: Stk1 family PASTA domain-containing Ser/Thr kinase [Actinomycetota bacterium]
MAKQRVLGNRYEIERVLGEGGMAKVFLGTDRVLGRTVAVKVLSPQYAEDQQFVARFRREAQAAAALNHPNIVSVFDTGSTGNVHYIVMEYVEGRTLQDTLREESRLTPERSIEIGEAVAKALSAAHAKGLVHRDIKPGNIMITREGQVKVMDFGIARATTSDTVTQTAAVLGTAAYLSPEQAQGETVDHRSDIYSLGVVLYEMLTGRQPFTGDSPVSIAYRHVTEDPTPPSRLNPDVRESLDAIVMTSMAKAPGDRYQSAQELIDDLRRASEGMPVAAAVPLPGDTTQVIDRGGHTQVLTGPLEEEMEEEEERGRRVGWIVFWTLLILAILGLASFFLVRALLTGPEPVTVPDVVGFNRVAAVQTLEEAGLEVEVVRRARDDVPADQVFRQDPEAGTEVDEGSLVRIFVSRGTRMVEVPSVVGLSQEEAQQAIEDAGLTLGFVGQEPSEEDPGIVISQDPQPETEVEEGSAVNIVISTGPETVAVPSVVCDSPEDARSEIEGRDLVYQEETEEFSDCPSGTVARQDPEAGAEVAPGSTVRVWISLGPSPEPSPTDSPTDGA